MTTYWQMTGDTWLGQRGGELNRGAILRFIASYVSEHGYPPTTREIAAGCYMVQSSVRYNLDRLQEQGWLTRLPGSGRAISFPAYGSAAAAADAHEAYIREHAQVTS